MVGITNRSADTWRSDGKWIEEGWKDYPPDSVTLKGDTPGGEPVAGLWDLLHPHVREGQDRRPPGRKKLQGKFILVRLRKAGERENPLRA
jgi:hypothetical protein